MRRREELNKLVVFTLSGSHEAPRARELYQSIKELNPHILVREDVTTFKSFVRLLHAFPEVKNDGIKPMRYFLAKGSYIS